MFDYPRDQIQKPRLMKETDAARCGIGVLASDYSELNCVSDNLSIKAKHAAVDVITTDEFLKDVVSV